MVLTAREVSQSLISYDDWEVEEKAISKRFLFPSFLEAITFVNRVATKAEKMQHHPEIEIKYNKVKFTLSTHSQGGVSEKDIHLAKIIEELL